MKVSIKPKASREVAAKYSSGRGLRNLVSSVKQGEIVLPIVRKFLADNDEAIRLKKIDRKDDVIADAKLTIACFKERLEAYEEDLSEFDDDDMFHPSQLGSCIRRIFFLHFKAPTNGPKLAQELLREHLIFEFGTYMHVLVQNLLHRAGILEKREVAITDREKGTIGHADGILKIGGRRLLLEIKSINSTGFGSLKEPKEEHKKQTHDYMDCLGLEGTVFLYFDKDRHNVKEFYLPFSAEYHAENVKKRKEEIFGAQRTRQLPRREGKNPCAFPCSYCEFHKLCFTSDSLKDWMKKNKVKGNAL